MTEQILLYEKQELVERENQIPDVAINIHGCNKCYWRNYDKCPNFDKETGRTNYPEEGICSMRKKWILSFVPRYKQEPSHHKFMLDLQIGMAQKWMQDEEEEVIRLKELKKALELDVKDKGEDSDELKALNRKIKSMETEIRKYKGDRNYLLTQTSKYLSERIKIDEPKISGQVIMAIKPSDITMFMRGAKDQLEKEAREKGKDES